MVIFLFIIALCAAAVMIMLTCECLHQFIEAESIFYEVMWGLLASCCCFGWLAYFPLFDSVLTDFFTVYYSQAIF